MTKRDNLCSDARVETPSVVPIGDISRDGAGIGHTEGLAVFVPGTLPGDLAAVKIERRYARRAAGRLERLISPSPDRIAPACAVFGRCGGCTLQSLAYPAQLRLKERQVADALRRIGRVPDLDAVCRPIIGMDHPWHYRANVQWPVGGTAANPLIGFYAAQSHEIVSAAACPVLPTVCDHIREAVRQHLILRSISPYDEKTCAGTLRRLLIRLGFTTGDVMVTLEINGDSFPDWEGLHFHLVEAIQAANDGRADPGPEPARPYHLQSFNLLVRQTNGEGSGCPPAVRLLAGQPWIEEVILGIRYRISPQSFFQVNPRQAARLFAAVKSMAGLTGLENVLDLYCGTGAAALQVAGVARQVVGVEINEEAIIDARINAGINKIHNVRFHAGDAGKSLLQLTADGFYPDLVILDPPRAGCEKALLDLLAETKPEQIIYISCDPATLARDLVIFQTGGFRVLVVHLVDMFPWTGHVECVVLISRAEKNVSEKV